MKRLSIFILLMSLAVSPCAQASSRFSAIPGGAAVVKLLGTLLSKDGETAEKPSEAPKEEEARPMKSGDEAAAPRLEERLQQLEIPEGKLNWRRDWWKFGVMFLVLAAGLAMIGYFLKVLVRLLNTVICTLISSVGAFLGASLLTPLIASWLPEGFRWSAKAIGGALGFLLAYAVTGTVMQILRRPLKADLRRQDCRLDAARPKRPGDKP